MTYLHHCLSELPIREVEKIKHHKNAIEVGKDAPLPLLTTIFHKHGLIMADQSSKKQVEEKVLAHRWPHHNKLHPILFPVFFIFVSLLHVFTSRRTREKTSRNGGHATNVPPCHREGNAKRVIQRSVIGDGRGGSSKWEGGRERRGANGVGGGRRGPSGKRVGSRKKVSVCQAEIGGVCCRRGSVFFRGANVGGCVFEGGVFLGVCDGRLSFRHVCHLSFVVLFAVSVCHPLFSVMCVAFCSDNCLARGQPVSLHFM